VACRELVKGDVLVPATGGEPQIIVQFDGSAHRMSQVGGAGAALLQLDGNGLVLLDWDARVSPKCAENIVAEANGADLALHLYEKYGRMCHEQGLLLRRIHGDIEQSLHQLDFRSRFRRSDLITLINTSIDVGAVQLLMLLQSTDPGKRTLSLTILLDKQVLGFSIILMTHVVFR